MMVERVLLCLREGGKAFVILLLPGLQLLFAVGQLRLGLREAGTVCLLYTSSSDDIPSFRRKVENM